MATAERREELKQYVKSLCLIYYNRRSEFYKDPAIRKLIDKAKKELQQ